ncbi:MAG: TIGR01777 family oxidoreductase [Planctomycetaceae bacterium]
MKRILISGATGLVGSELSRLLTTGGHEVIALTRRESSTDVRWSPEAGTIEADKLAGFDAVVHLAGENVIGRWTAEKKRRIRDSRVHGTRLLCETLAQLPTKTATLVCASATGYYGNRGDEILTEDCPKGTGFLPDVCEAWEAACEPARQAGIRVVTVRIGIVLTPGGGLLGKLLFLFRAGLGGHVGDGRQWMGWIAIDDLVDIFQTSILDESLSGVINATSPNPVTNAEFTKALGRVVRRPTLLPVPKIAVKAALGSAADELALASARVVPARLQARGHTFRQPLLEPALRTLLGRESDRQVK